MVNISKISKTLQVKRSNFFSSWIMILIIDTEMSYYYDNFKIFKIGAGAKILKRGRPLAPKDTDIT